MTYKGECADSKCEEKTSHASGFCKFHREKTCREQGCATRFFATVSNAFFCRTHWKLRRKYRGGLGNDLGGAEG